MVTYASVEETDFVEASADLLASHWSFVVGGLVFWRLGLAYGSILVNNWIVGARWLGDKLQTANRDMNDNWERIYGDGETEPFICPICYDE